MAIWFTWWAPSRTAAIARCATSGSPPTTSRKAAAQGTTRNAIRWCPSGITPNGLKCRARNRCRSASSAPRPRQPRSSRRSKGGSRRRSASSRAMSKRAPRWRRSRSRGRAAPTWPGRWASASSSAWPRGSRRAAGGAEMADGSALPAAASRSAARIAWRGAVAVAGERPLAEEAPVSFAYQGAAYAVMMATPADLEDFAVGFTLTEGLVARRAEIDILPQPEGVVLRIDLSAPRAERFWRRRRHLAGPSGCGLCGIENLAESLRAVPRVESELTLSCGAVGRALESLSRRQTLHQVTRSVHAAAFWRERDGLVALREDVGRHNALDKLAGALARSGAAAGEGALLLTSRLSVEMVQKAAMIGAPVVIAMSAPTMLAVRVAETAGITLAAVARADGFEIFTHPRRFRLEG